MFNFKLLMFKRALIVQDNTALVVHTRMFETTLELAMKMVRLVDRETRATAN